MQKYFPFLIIILLPVILFAPVWMGFVDFYSGDASDLIPYIYGIKQFLYQTFQELGGISLWNPYLFFGQPAVGNIQYSLFYPLNIFFLFIPFFKALWIYQVLHLIIAGLGTYLLARYTGGGKYGSTLSGCLYMLNGRILYYINAGWVGYFGSICWLPMVILMALYVYKRKELYFPALLGIALAMTFLAGTPQYTLLGCFLFVIQGVFKIFSYQTKEERVSLLFRMFLTGIILFLLIGVQLFPAIEQTYLSSRVFLADGLNGFHFEWDIRQWFRILFRPELLNHDFAWELCAYIGVGGIALSLPGFFSARERLVLCFIWGFIPWLVSMGPAFPPFAVIMKTVPGMSILTSPSRYFIFSILILCIAAGHGLEFAVDRYENAKGKINFYFITACFFIILIGLLVEPYDLDSNKANIRFLSAVVIFFLLIYLNLRHKSWTLKILLLCVLIADPIVLSVDILNREYRIKDLKAPQKIILALKKYPGSVRIATIQPEALRDNLLNPFDDSFSAEYKIRRAGGYDPLAMLSTLQFLTKMDGTGEINDAMWGFRLWGFSRPDLYNIAGITHIITYTPLEDPALKFVVQDSITMPHFHGGWWTDQPVYLYQNINVFPRAFFLPHGSPGSISPIEISSSSPDHLYLKFQIKQSGTAVISESFHPGWIPVTDDTSVYLKPFLNTFISFNINEGDHNIVLKFSPKSFHLGLWFTVSGLLLILIVIVYQAVYHTAKLPK